MLLSFFNFRGMSRYCNGSNNAIDGPEDNVAHRAISFS